jgi:hypothetical protein
MGVKERDARALRCAGVVKERNARSRSPDEIDQHRRAVLEGAGSSVDVCAGPGGAGSDEQFDQDKVHGSFALASFPRCMGASDIFMASHQRAGHWPAQAASPWRPQTEAVESLWPAKTRAVAGDAGAEET